MNVVNHSQEQTNRVRLGDREVDAGTVGDLVRARAGLGDKPLLWVGDNVVSYAEAHTRSDQLAAGLAGLGIDKGDVVATFLYNSPEHLCLWFACAKLGAIWAPTNVSLIERDLSYALEDCAARVLVVEPDLLDVYLAARKHLAAPPTEVLLGEPELATTHGMLSLESLLSSEATPPTADVRPGDAMTIMYTGGSTGLPKGVLVPHLYYMSCALRYEVAANPSPDDVHFAVGHLFHTGGQSIGVMGPMYAGMSTVMARWFSASRYWSRAREHNATIIDPIGPIISAVLRQPPSADDRQHDVRIGVGVATGQIRPELRDEFERRFDVPLLEVYAQAETGVILTTETLADRRGSNGKAHGWADIQILDDDGFPAAPGIVGEIAVRPRHPHSFMIEYWHKPEQTIAAWRDLWFHSGDLGYLDNDGYLYFTGRQAHWIRRRGENVSSFEVERIVCEHPSVADAAAVGVPAEMGDEDIKVYVQIAEGRTLAAAELVEHCAAQVSYFKVPRYVEFVESLPRSAAKQEIERHKLRELGIGDAWDAEAQSDARPRRSPHQTERRPAN